MEKKLKEIGLRIEQIIKDAGISRARLGDLLGVKEGAVGRHIRGETEPGISALVTIAKIGNVTLDWLITGKENESDPSTSSREEALKEVAIAAYRGDRDFAVSICEAAGVYTATDKLGRDEKRLLENYRHASDEIKEEAFGMLERSARRSREKDGGGSGSQAGNCA